MLLLLYLGLLGVMAWPLWWLSGYDSKLTGENQRSDYLRRMVRCGLTLVLEAVLFWLPGTVLFIPLLVAVVWAGCVAGLYSHGFHRLIDPEFYDDREFDPEKEKRHLDALANLIQTGRRDEALRLCGELQRSGEVNPVTLDATREYLGEKPEHPPRFKPLAEAARLRAGGKFAEAEPLLRSLLAANPANLAAAMALMRLYAQDLHQPGQAAEVLRQLEKQPHMAAGHIEFARRSIDEWSRPPAAADRPASVDELLAGGRCGTAIEILEARLRAQPDDFDLRLKLAEAYGRYCGNVDHAEKIVREIETTAGFSPAQVQQAQNRLQAWRRAGPAPAA
jgi:tetratricopeptide (TPR) repeat protein